MDQIKKRIPMSEEHLSRVRELFDLYDSDADNSLNLNELAVLLQEIGNKITALPATAQVASQQERALDEAGRAVRPFAASWCVLTDYLVQGYMRPRPLAALIVVVEYRRRYEIRRESRSHVAGARSFRAIMHTLRAPYTCMYLFMGRRTTPSPRFRYESIPATQTTPQSPCVRQRNPGSAPGLSFYVGGC